MPVSLMIAALRMGSNGSEIMQILDALTSDSASVESDTDTVDTVVK